MSGTGATLHIEISADNKEAVKVFRETQRSAFNLTEELKKYQSLVFTEKDSERIRQYNKRIQELEVQIKKTTNAGKDGFDAMGVAIEKTGNPLTKAFSGLRQIAYILPGIGIAGLFNVAFDAIGKAVNELGLFVNTEDAAAKAAADLNKELLKQREGAEGEVSHMKALADAASNASLTNEQRLVAVKKLRSEFPGYFKDLSDEQILTGNITKATDSLTQAIYKRAEARAREADIAKKATQVFENQNKIDVINAKITERQKVEPSKKQGGLDFRSDLVNEQSANILNDLLKERDKLLTENSSLQIDIAQSQQRVNKITAESIVLDEKQTVATKKKTDAFKEYMDAYYKRFGSRAQAVNQDTKDPTGLLGKPVTRINDDSKTGSGVFDSDFGDQAEKKRQQMASLNDEIRTATIIANLAAESFGKLFESLAQGENIGEAITKVFTDLVKEIASAAIKAFAFAVVLNVLTGGTAGAIGLLFKGAFGAAIGTGGGNTGHSKGGLSVGPESGHWEKLHGNEWVLRPEQLGGALNAARMSGAMEGGYGDSRTQTVEVVGVIRGNDIHVSQQRTSFQRGLTTGIR